MTFKETEFPSLIKFLKSFVTEEADPNLIKDVLLQFIKIYEDVPLYPGIVGMCMGNLIKTVNPQEITIDQKVYIKCQGDCYYGTVAGKNSDGIILKHVKMLSSDDEIELEFREMDRVAIVNEKVLKELWPSLVFEKEKKR